MAHYFPQNGVAKRIAQKNQDFDAEARKFLAQFPDDAVGWEQATDEPRDFFRSVREVLGLSFEDTGVDAKAAGKTPSAWNTTWKQGAMKLISQCTPEQKQTLYNQWFGPDR